MIYLTQKEASSFQRGSGILMSITSLPSPYGIGTLGKAAYEFVDYLRRAQQRYWQVLPIGPTSFGDSPYQSFSAFAGNPYFIDLDTLVEEGLLQYDEINCHDWGYDATKVDYAKIFESRFTVLRKAFDRSNHRSLPEFRKFCEENVFWLEDYSLFMALKFYFDNREWQLWENDIRLRKPGAVKLYTDKLANDVAFWKFLQFKFFEQWNKLKAYANDRGIKIIGDIPIYVAMDSADTWVHGDLFQLDEEKKPVKVAGVPPDNFSADGQLWGNPLYDWDKMEKNGFAWWKQRMRASAKIYDVIRIDHFIGVVKYFAIPAEATTAAGGKWMPGPGIKLINAMNSVLGNSLVIAEDLGVLDEKVETLLKKAGYPGMKVLQFGFDGGSDNVMLPHNISENYVVYGGTHDNETLVGYFCDDNKSIESLRYAVEYLNCETIDSIPDAIIRVGFMSCAHTVIYQLQDYLGLDNSARMNFPSKLGGNWEWRATKAQMSDKLAARIARLVEIYGR